MIEIVRKDGSKRNIEIMFDKASNKYCYVNLTSNHVCQKRYDTYNDAIKSIYDEEFVSSWSYVEPKKEKHNLNGLFHYLGIMIKSIFGIKSI